MRKFRRIATLALAIAIAASSAIAFSGCDKKGGSANLSNDGKTLVIYSWNDEFEIIMNDYYLKDNPLPDGIKFKYVNLNGSGTYQTKLDNAIAGNQEMDIFLMEADYAKKYINSANTVALTEIGITEKDMQKNQYQYTIDVAKDNDGVIKGSSWQAAPGLFMYRRDIAKNLLGTDDPAAIQEMVADWDKFLDTAKTLSDKSDGKTKIVSSIDDIWQAVRTARTASWVDKDNKLNSSDPVIDGYLDLAKSLLSNDYVANFTPWTTEWNSVMNTDEVLGFFGTTWFPSYPLMAMSTDHPEDWAAVQGPIDYYWGGTWVAVSPNCDNKDIVKDIIEYITIETESMQKYASGKPDYVNNKAAIDNIIAEGGNAVMNKFFGGQNVYEQFKAMADKVDTSTMSAFDQDINNLFLSAAKGYGSGKIEVEGADTVVVSSKEDAISYFKTKLQEDFAFLTVD